MWNHETNCNLTAPTVSQQQQLIAWTKQCLDILPISVVLNVYTVISKGLRYVIVSMFVYICVYIITFREHFCYLLVFVLIDASELNLK